MTNLKTLLFTLITLFAFSSCGTKTNRNLTIFEIGDSREKVINTIVSDFTFDGVHPTKDDVLDGENGNHITMYDCVYKGQEYYKVRIYYSEEKVRRMEFKIEKDKIQNIVKQLEKKYGTPHRTEIPYILNSTIKANVFINDIAAVVLLDNDDECFEIMVLSGEDRNEINRSL